MPIEALNDDGSIGVVVAWHRLHRWRTTGAG
jgi:hypothetical protein